GTLANPAVDHPSPSIADAERFACHSRPDHLAIRTSDGGDAASQSHHVRAESVEEAMPSILERGFKPNLLCIVPPSALTSYPPAGAAYLLAYLKANGCREFDFVDLRLGAPAAYSPTYNYTGIFGDAWVFDIPDLPLVLQLLDNVWKGSGLEWKRTAA